MAEANALAEMPPINFAVFGNESAVCLVRLEEPDAEQATTRAAASGYAYLGSMGVNEGVPTVQIETSAAAPTMMLVGPLFAELLGPEIQRFQLQQRAKNELRTTASA